MPLSLQSLITITTHLKQKSFS